MPKFQFGLLAIIALILLRFVVGWHFYQSGLEKFENPSYSSTPFFRSAQGPGAKFFQDQIPDRYGLLRLDYTETAKDWDTRLQDALSKQRLTEEQTEEVNTIYKGYKDQLEWYLAKNIADDLASYQLEATSLKELQNELDFSSPDYQKQRARTREAKLLAQSAPWLKQVETIRSNLENDLNGLANTTQNGVKNNANIDENSPKIAPKDKKTVKKPVASAKKWYEFPSQSYRPVHPLLPNSTLDDLTKWVLLAIGFMLILGLFTRLASLAGIAFLASIIWITWQPVEVGISPTQYQEIELIALFLLLATAAGRYGGLDYLIHHGCRCCFRRCFRRPEKETS
ncbi:MAG: DoxX family protein [Pirellulaceae bacterium]|nr:DoxX family protein [Pirellulaceae bacterium]